MFNVILLSLGILLSSAPGLGGLCSPREVVQSPPEALHSHPLLRRAAPHGHPSPASREETNLSDPEEKAEESDDFLLVCNACPGDRIPAMGRRDGAIVGPVPRHAFLHQLHHSWQLLC